MALASPLNLEVPSSAEAFGISELLLGNPLGPSLVYPSLAYLTHQSDDRWLTWLAPRGLSKQQLQEFGFDLRRTRFIYPRNPEHSFWLFWQALAEGNSHTVVGQLADISAEQLRCLERGARAGQCSGLVLRNRGQ